MSILHKLNKNLGTYLFNIPNSVTYSLFNYLYNKFIINLDDADEEIRFFHKHGYLKPKINFRQEVVELKKSLDEKSIINNSSSTHVFNLNENSKNIIKDILNSSKFKILKEKIERYYNLKIYLVNVLVTKNFPIKKDIEHKVNLYSNNYHADYYINNFFKMFVNLHDVDETQGPMNLYSKKNSRKFIRYNNYKDRSSYDLKDEVKLGLVKNTGLEGDLFLCSTPQCLHRASSPDNGKTRYMLFFSFAATIMKNDSNNNLFSLEKEYYNDIWENKSKKLVKTLCKPKSARKQIKFFINFFKNKIKK